MCLLIFLVFSIGNYPDLCKMLFFFCFELLVSSIVPWSRLDWTSNDILPCLCSSIKFFSYWSEGVYDTENPEIKLLGLCIIYSDCVPEVPEASMMPLIPHSLLLPSTFSVFFFWVLNNCAIILEKYGASIVGHMRPQNSSPVTRMVHRARFWSSTWPLSCVVNLNWISSGISPQQDSPDQSFTLPHVSVHLIMIKAGRHQVRIHTSSNDARLGISERLRINIIASEAGLPEGLDGFSKTRFPFFLLSPLPLLRNPHSIVAVSCRPR